MFGTLAVVLQLVHMAVDFLAIRTLVAHGLDRFFGEGSAATTIVAIVAITAMHTVLNVSWTTYWYDCLDKDTRTDSSMLLPLGIAIMMVFLGYRGTSAVLNDLIEKPELHDSDGLNEGKKAAMATIAQSADGQAKQVRDTYSSRIKSTKNKYATEIRGYRSRKARSEADRDYVARLVADGENKRDQAVAALEAERDAQLTSITSSRVGAESAASARADTLLGKMTAIDVAELDRVRQEKEGVWRYAFGLSAGLIIIIMLLLYKKVRINVESGILPVRDFTKMQEHGSLGERLGAVLSDIWQRNMFSLTTKLHRWFSPRDLTELDGRVITEQGSYMSPRSPRQAVDIDDPTAPNATQVNASEQAISDVFEKAGRERVFLTKSEFLQEVARATSLGHAYLSTPYATQYEKKG